ncbi:phage antirepressor [Streptomyces pseudovenezuelae]|uniref:phage antirepressor n=1 Tax=Streptomyces pseudovenezuelae TaxID=67350 RepID=UPI0037FE6C2F
MVASSQDPSRNRGLERFTNSEFAVELLPHGDSFKVVASGVAHALGFYSAKDMLRTVPDTEKGWELAPTPGGDQQVHVLLEPGFYRVIGQRQAARVKDLAVRDQVERFQSWVYGEVLPSIRKQGAAAPALPQDYEEALVHLLDKVRENKQLESKVRELEPAAQAWDVLASAEGDYSLREAALILNRDRGISTGQNRLLRSIRELDMIDRKGVPYAKHASHLVERATSYVHPHTNEPTLSKQIRVTAQGLRYLHKRLGGEGPLQLSA